MKSQPGPPMTFGAAAVAQVRLIVWCKACQHQVEPDPAEMAARYGAETSVLDWREKLVCSRSGGRQADMVVTGTRSEAVPCGPNLGPKRPATGRNETDRDRGTPHGATPPTPPGIRVTYHGGSIGLGLQGRAFGCWLRHQWFGPLVIAERGFTPINRSHGQ